MICIQCNENLPDKFELEFIFADNKFFIMIKNGLLNSILNKNKDMLAYQVKVINGY